MSTTDSHPSTSRRTVEDMLHDSRARGYAALRVSDRERTAALGAHAATSSPAYTITALIPAPPSLFAVSGSDRYGYYSEPVAALAAVLRTCEGAPPATRVVVVPGPWLTEPPFAGELYRERYCWVGTAESPAAALDAAGVGR